MLDIRYEGTLYTIDRFTLLMIPLPDENPQIYVQL